MKLRRMAATLSATFDDALCRLENHEAVAQCAIDDLRKGVAQIKVQRNRAQAELEQLEYQADEAQKGVSDWQARAVRFADDDEAKALDCLARAEQQQAQAERLAQQIEAHQKLVDELQATLQKAEAQLQQLTLKKSALAARGARSRSLKAVERAECDGTTQEIFDRWEVQVMTDEVTEINEGVSVDRLERELLAEEEQARLKEKLAALRESK